MTNLSKLLLLASVFLLLTACAATTALGPTIQADYQLTAEDKVIIQRMISNMVTIPAGSFQMGDRLGEGESDELPVREVEVTAFALSRYEVTFEQYDLFARMTGEDAPSDRWGREKRPVIDVTWHDAADFTVWAAQVTGLPMRLPTEAEWEYAARGSSLEGEGNLRYAVTDDADTLCEWANIADQNTDIGWRNESCADAYSETAPVGSFKANAYGLYDMQGNVWEWLSDCWHSSYKGAPSNSENWGDLSCDEYVQRGGSWFSDVDEVRSSFRVSGDGLDKSVTLGFRLAHD